MNEPSIELDAALIRIQELEETLRNNGFIWSENALPPRWLPPHVLCNSLAIQTPAKGSAVEWLNDECWVDPNGANEGLDLSTLLVKYSKALELAKRCDVAEFWMEQFRHQLAAAQVEASALRVSWQNAETTIRHLEERLNEEISHSKAY